MNIENAKLYTAKETCKIYNISYKTLDRWANSNKIKYIKTITNHRRFIIDNIPTSKKCFIYTRVSSKKQDGDLQRQINFMSKKLPNVEVITDIGSAFNFNRKGFQYILTEVFKGNIDKVYVSEPDRFARISFQFFEWIFEYHGAKLISISTEISKKQNYEYEFSKDIISIITHYTAKYYGKHKYGNNRKKNDPMLENSDISE